MYKRQPQEALVLTLFGDYIGTLKGQGFYWVNPFCTAVNPDGSYTQRYWNVIHLSLIHI